MSRTDWYGNPDWSEAVEGEFRRRLARARDKAQPLRIKAHFLAERHPRAALALLDEYFALGEHFDRAQAYVERARAWLALADVDAALVAYRDALDEEMRRPNVQTRACLDFARLVAVDGRSDLFEAALNALDQHRGPLLFPADRYVAHGSRAIILSRMGQREEARSSAIDAMAAAALTRSGFSSHQSLGLVKDVSDPFGRQVAALAA